MRRRRPRVRAGRLPGGRLVHGPDQGACGRRVHLAPARDALDVALARHKDPVALEKAVNSLTRSRYMDMLTAYDYGTVHIRKDDRPDEAADRPGERDRERPPQRGETRGKRRTVHRTDDQGRRPVTDGLRHHKVTSPNRDDGMVRSRFDDAGAANRVVRPRHGGSSGVTTNGRRRDQRGADDRAVLGENLPRGTRTSPGTVGLNRRPNDCHGRKETGTKKTREGPLALTLTCARTLAAGRGAPDE